MISVSDSRERIGIMSDSHGRCDAIARASETLKLRECSALYHLGDICDSGLPATADECVRMIKKNSIHSIKGNNDHILALNNTGQDNTAVAPETALFLRALPPIIEFKDMAFTHSLPFYSTMGNAALMRVMEDENRRYLFSETDYRIIFRGHSHSPEYVCLDNTVMSGASLKPGQKLHLGYERRYVITCGALMDGYVMLYDCAQAEIECIAL